MASFSGLKITSFLPLVVVLVLAYHVVILVEGGRDIASRLSEEEDLELERQLNILNKPPVKTIHTQRGVIYDCIEFHNQPAFDNPLLKNHVIPKIDETASTRPHKTLVMSQIEECPKGTVPIRRTTKEDLIRAKYLSSTSNAPGDEYRAGITLQIEGERFLSQRSCKYMATKSKTPTNLVQQTAVRAGPTEQINEIRFGWIVNPQLYGHNLTAMFAYWTSDGGKSTGCYNTFCLDLCKLIQNQLLICTSMIYRNVCVILQDRETENWWLILEDTTKIGYWPKDLFQHFYLGAEHIYWGGRVKSGQDGIPEMASGNLPNRFPDHTGYYSDLQYKNQDDSPGNPDDRVQITVDCKGSYNSLWDNEHTILHYGGPGGGTCA
ncbi:hypothetical protein MKX03_009899 [Papaver bracteatum]|nr:hypothetical protein MKX03_009899 [Papaver bracteatum]